MSIRSLLFVSLIIPALSIAANENHSSLKRHSVGSSLYLLGNFLSITHKEPVINVHITYSFRLTHKDVLLGEGYTWTFFEPLGANGSSKYKYSGKRMDYGLSIGYRRFLWRDLYSAVYATPYLTQYYDSNNKAFQNGFQLTLRTLLGYHFEFFQHRLYLQPAVEFRYWPVNTNTPLAFGMMDKQYANYALFRPNLYFGYQF